MIPPIHEHHQSKTMSLFNNITNCHLPILLTSLKINLFINITKTMQSDSFTSLKRVIVTHLHQKRPIYLHHHIPAINLHHQKNGWFICITKYQCILFINITKKIPIQSWLQLLATLGYCAGAVSHFSSCSPLLSSTMASRVLPVLFLFFFSSRGLFMCLLLFVHPAFLGAAYGRQYLIAASSGVNLNVSISKWQVSFVSTGYWLRQHSVVHQTGMEFAAVNSLSAMDGRDHPLKN